MQRVLRKKHTDLLFSLFLLVLLAFSVTHMAVISEGVFSALTLCARAIIPTLFPFLILTDLLLSVEGTEKILSMISFPLAKLLHLSKQGGTVVLLGAVFGFPMGAKAVAHYYSEGRLSKEESERLLLFCGNASPFFLIGSVGIGMLSSLKAGITIYGIQLGVSFICGLILGLFSKNTGKMDKNALFHQKKISFSHTVQGAVRQVLFISGYVVFFSAILSFTLPYIKSPFLSRLLASCLEIGNACSLASESGKYALPFCAFSACFSGLSVYFQTLDCIEGSDLSTKSYLPIKLICGALGFYIALFVG